MPRSAHARTAPLSRKRAIRSTLILACIAACAGSTAPVAYGQYYWDPNHTLTTTAGGSGTWDLITANWFDPGSGEDVTLNGSDPYFAGAGGVVILSPNWIYSEHFFLNSGGYVFNGTSTSNSFSVLHPDFGFTQSASATGVNVISVPIDSNGPIYINAGTLDLTNTNPIQPNYGSDITVATGATFECIATPQATAMFQGGQVKLSGTLQLDLQGSATPLTPIPVGTTVGLYDGSRIVFTGAPNPVSLGALNAVTAGPNGTASSIISGPAGTVLYVDRLGIPQNGTFTLENDLDINAQYLMSQAPAPVLVKTGTGRLSVEGAGVLAPGATIKVQQGVFAVEGTLNVTPDGTVNFALDGGTLSLEAASGSPVYDTTLAVTNRGGTLAVGAPSATLGSSANGVTLQGGLEIDTSPSTIANHLIIAGNITGPGQAITVHGTGALTFAGVSTVSATTAHASFLEVNGTLNSDTVTIDTAGMLGGHGTINGSVSLLDHAILAPSGSSASLAGSTLTFLGPVKFMNSDTEFSVNTAGSSSGQFDQVVFADNLSIQGNLIVNDINGPLAPGSKLWIMDGLPGSSPETGEFFYNGALLQSGSEFTLADGATYQIDYNLPGDPAGTGNDVVLTAVPEPAFIPSFAGALLLLARRRRNVCSC